MGTPDPGIKFSALEKVDLRACIGQERSGRKREAVISTCSEGGVRFNIISSLELQSLNPAFSLVALCSCSTTTVPKLPPAVNFVAAG